MLNWTASRLSVSASENLSLLSTWLSQVSTCQGKETGKSRGEHPRTSLIMMRCRNLQGPGLMHKDFSKFQW
ncbi:hypothetical protein BJX66DRAFT_34252 [Aspergillus keveii]|uniref:Uncharacterized protein n=1 Tax=Aspergillus keveii TaxID=714993 RepID=A0ABR4GHN8_9EURO